MGIFANPPPPKDLRQFLTLAKIYPDRTYRYSILSHRIYGWEFHWVDRQTVVCTKSAGKCPHCSPTQRCRWMGFLAVLGFRSRQPLLLPVTDTAYDWCPEVQYRDGNLRGVAIAVSRMGDKKNSPQKIEVFDPLPHERLPSDAPNPNVPNAVGRIFHFDALGFADESQAEDNQCQHPNGVDQAEVASSLASDAISPGHTQTQRTESHPPQDTRPFAPRAWRKES